MTPDWSHIVDKLIITLVSGLGTWLLSTVLRLRRDMDAAFSKIRTLEKELGYDDVGTNAAEQRD